MAGQDLNKVCGNLLLVLAYTSALSCLIRSDYNFAFALFFYYIWIVKRDSDTTLFIGIGLVLLSLLDVAWFVMVGGTWNTDLPTNALWTSLRTGHTFVLIVSTVNLLLKGLTGGLIFYTRSFPDDLGQAMINKRGLA